MEHNDVEIVADWMNHFYRNHIQRWNNTKTESIYSYSQNPIILNNKVKAKEFLNKTLALDPSNAFAIENMKLLK